MNIALLIPAYQPGGALLSLLRALDPQSFSAIVLVDDGSGPEYRAVFDEAAALPRVHVLRHDANRGKGAALKTGIAFANSQFPALAGIVTADADGQHHPEDIERIARILERQPGALVLGARGFHGDVPWRSRIGNAFSRRVVHAVIGQKLSDTQTGLRGIPAVLWSRLLQIEANGYEFELEMLIEAHRLGIRVCEEPIRTIYQPGNPTSHFNPIADSMKVYFVLLRFASVSVLTAVLDNVVFYLAFRRSGHILASQIAGRTLAVAFNYWMVRRSVFYSRKRHLLVLPQYLTLVLVSGAASYAGIRLLSSRAGLHPVIAKLLVESALFFANFAVQRLLIFTPQAASRAGPSRRVRWIAWLVSLALAAAIAIDLYGFLSANLFAQSIWFPIGIRRLFRYAGLFTEVSLPVLLMAPWMFTGTAAILMLAGTAVAAPAGLFAAAFFLLSCWALGSRLLRGAGAASSILLGASVYIFLMTWTARLPVHYPVVWGAVLAIPVAMDFRRAAQAISRLAGAIRRAALPSTAERAAFALLVFVVGMHWLVALKPETGADGLAMHLAIPTNIAAHHRMTYEPGRILWSVMPMGADWTYSITYLLGGEAAPRLLNFSAFLLLLWLLYTLVRRWVSRPAAFLLLAAFAATPLVQLVTGSLFVENLLAAMVLGSVTALLRFAGKGEARYFVLAAALAGSALAIKLAALAAILTVLPFALVEAWRRRLRPAVLALSIILFLAAAAPTYLIAWKKTGDPLFPYLLNQFPSPILDRSVILRDPRFREPLTWRTPFDLTFHSSRYFEGQDGSFGFQYPLLGALALLAALAVWRKEVTIAAAAALGPMAAVLLSEPNLRYLYAELPLLLIPTAALLGWLDRNRRWLARALMAFLAACTALDVYFLPASGWYQKEFYSQLVFERHGKERFLRESAPDRDVVLYFARQHPNAPVLLAGDSDLADVPSEAYVPNWHQYGAWQSIENAPGRRELLRLFDQWNVRYVVARTPPPGRAIQPPAFADLVDHCLVREYENHRAYVARIDPACGESAPTLNFGLK